MSNEQRFLFLGDARAFQRKMQRKGYATKLIHHIGCAHPYRIVQWNKR